MRYPADPRLHPALAPERALASPGREPRREPLRDAFQRNRPEQRSEQCLGCEVRQVDAGDRDSGIAQGDGLLFRVQPRRTCDHGFHFPAEDIGFGNQLDPPLAAVAQRGTGERGEFRVVQQGGALNVADRHGLEPVLGGDIAHHQIGVCQGQLGIAGDAKLVGNDMHRANRPSCELGQEGKARDLDPR